MSQQDLSEAVKRKTAEIIGNIAAADLDTTKTLRSYGVSSLDLVELVSFLMRELKIKVARSELKKIATTDDLIAILQKSADQPAAT